MAASPRQPSLVTVNRRRTNSRDKKYQHFLETGVRSSEADRLRKKRWLGWLYKAFIFTAVAGGLYFGARRAVAHFVLSNPQYLITDLNVETDGVLRPEDILEAATLHKGENIFHVDLAKAQSRVAAMPQVERVQITRQLPSRVSIQINERKPVAWVAPILGASSREDVVASKQSWMVDLTGVLLRPRRSKPEDLYLPIIRNYGEKITEEGQPVTGEEMKAALDLLHAQQDASPTMRFQIQEIDLSKHFGLNVTDRSGLQVLFGLDEMDRQLKRLDVYLQTLEGRAQKPQTINLLVQRNVPVTFAVNALTTDKPPMPTATPAALPPVPSPATKKEKAKTKAAVKPSEKPRAKPSHTSPPSKKSKPKGQPFLEH